MTFTEVLYWIDTIWPYLFGFVGLPIAIWASAHAILNKREVRATIGWVGVILLVPFVGSFLYYLLGINRIQRKAERLLGERMRIQSIHDDNVVTEEKLEALLPPGHEHLLTINRLSENVVQRPLLAGNKIIPLLGGEKAYPEMLQAIREAKHTIGFISYIFDVDEVGKEFRQALKEAHERGVKVRVLVDAVGARYSRPTIDTLLRADDVPVARFMPTLIPWRATYMNLRNHRKILVVDGNMGFTGGMNIRVGHDLSRNSDHPVQDLHFRIEGPVVSQMMEAFAEDWHFSTNEQLKGDEWFPKLTPVGESVARGIKDGPDEDFEKLRFVILNAISNAHECVRIMSPYFLPDATLTTALNLAALRGIKVQIVIPSKNNLWLLQWATSAHLTMSLNEHCELYFSPPPFDHTKLILIDRTWCSLGSANWDPRSFRLNFEFNIETYDSVLVESLDDFFSKRVGESERILLDDIRKRPIPYRLRDGIARLLSPYL